MDQGKREISLCISQLSGIALCTANRTLCNGHVAGIGSHMTGSGFHVTRNELPHYLGGRLITLLVGEKLCRVINVINNNQTS